MKLDSIMVDKINFGVGALRGFLSDRRHLGDKIHEVPDVAGRRMIEDAIIHIEGAARFVERVQRERFKVRSKANRKAKKGKRK